MAPPARAPLRVLLGYARPHRTALFAGGLLALLGGASGIAQPLAARAVVEALDRDERVVGPLVALTLLVLGGAILGAFGKYLMERTAESVVLAARRRLVGRILRLRVAEVERTRPGDLLSRVSSDTTLLRQVTTQSMVDLVTGSLLLVAAAVVMAVVEPVLFGVTAVIIAVIAVITAFLLPPILRATTRAQEAIGAMGDRLERALGAFRTLKANGAQEREIAGVEREAERAWHAGVSMAKWSSTAGVATWLAIQGSFLAVLGVGGARVASGDIDVATLIAFLLLLFYLTEPISSVVGATTQLQAGRAAVARIGEIDDLAIEPAPHPGSATASATAADAASGPATVSFREVGFRYRPELPPVLYDVSFEVPAGGLTAVVGPSGSGKSTTFALIERFHEVDRGMVTVDGRDVRDWPVHDLRAAIGYVEQDAPVLAGTLRDNLRFGAPDATDAALTDAVERARLTDLVTRLPDGLDTIVGHRGNTLSGGERQRVAIARALLRRPRLLLLDEITSQLDAVTELALRDLVVELARDTTVIVVAHRLSTITAADRIVVLENGTVRADGTHAELLVQDDLYARLAAGQFLTAQAT